MATTIDGINVKISADTSQMLSAMSKAKTGMIAFGTAIGSIAGNLVTKAFSAMSSEISNAISRFDTLNNFPRVMSNLNISAQDSEKAINYLSEKLQGLPTKIDTAALSVQRFTSANGDIKGSTAAVLALNNALLAGGASADIQASALEQVSQAYAKGKPDMVEWRSVLTAMPAQAQQLATAMGYVSASDLGEALRTGKVSMNDFMSTVVRLNNEGVNGFKSFEEQARNATGGVATSITNLRTAIQRGIANIMEVIGQAGIASFFNNVAKAVGTASKYIAAFISLVLSAINALSALFGGKSQAKISSVGSAADAAASSVGSIGESANDATGALGNTGKAAKKLQQQLAGFDEMNVLREQDTSSGSGGGSGGSGGGGASAGAIEGANIDWDATGFGKFGDEVAEIADRIKKKLGEIFDFETIGNAIKRFANDVKKGLEPIGKIANKVWNKYLKPFLSWTGNCLLPSVLNAIGGAIRFVGSVISALWDTFLEPFIDNFLVPIAQWTGGVIVSVLNGIGDALRSLSENRTVCEIIANGLTAVGVAIAGIKIANFVSSVINFGTQLKAFSETGSLVSGAVGLMTMKFNDAGPAFSMLKESGLSTSEALETLAANGIKAGSMGNSLKGVFSGIGEMIFSPLTIAIEGVILALKGLEAIQILCNIATTEAQTEEYKHITAQEFAENAARLHNDAIQRQISLKEELKEKSTNIANAELALFDQQQAVKKAFDEATSTASNYGMTLEEARAAVEKIDITSGDYGNLQTDLVQKVLKLTSAEKNEETQIKNLRKEKEEYTESQNKHIYSVLEEIRTEKESELQALINAKRYDEVASSIQELSKQTITYKDENGKTCTVTSEEVGYMCNLLIANLGTFDTEQSKVWKNLSESAGYSSGNTRDEVSGNIDELIRLTKEKGDDMKRSGEALGESCAHGILNKKEKMKESAEAITERGVGAVLNSKNSFEWSGSNLAQGIINGIYGKLNELKNAGRAAGRAVQSGFNEEERIQSPSREMMKSGGFWGDGVIIGVERKKSELAQVGKEVADALNISFEKMLDSDTSSLGKVINDYENGIKTSLSETIEASAKTNITVKIGEETLVDKIIDGINETTFLQNRNSILI